MDKANILIVEDEGIVAQDIKATLENMGYGVVGIASTGKDAIEKASQTNPDLVLMDIKLKGDMDGIEATKKISDQTKIPVVFLTAYANEEILEKAKSSKAFGYIVKPFEENNLNSTIQMALQKSKDVEQMLTVQKDSGAGLDLYDRKILYEIDFNARISASEIGKKLRLPKGTINYRINKLIENGYINKFYTIINASLLGYQYFRVSMSLRNIPPEEEEKLIKFIKDENRCVRLRVAEGASNIVFFSLHTGLSDLSKFLDRFNRGFGQYLLEKDVSSITRTHKYNQRFLLDTKDYNKTVISYDGLTKYDADETDLGILRILLSDARIKLIDMANMLGIDWKVIKYRIEKMKDKGVIIAYTADLNLQKIDREIIQIDISLRDSGALPDIVGFFNNTNVCTFAYEMVGKNDLSVELYVKDDEMLKKILAEFQKSFLKSFVSYEVTHVYREYVFNSLP
jgi:DNA-binding Lrp family transcriptional regulator/CheY-like chemotaxis protein